MSKNYKNYKKSGSKINESKSRNPQSQVKKKTGDCMEDKFMDKKDRNYNDPIWRKYDDQLANSVGNFTFNQFLGTSFSLTSPLASDMHLTYQLSPLMTLYVNPSCGYAASSTDAINSAALAMYTTLSANNAKTTQYAPQDVATAILAIGELNAMASFIIRTISTQTTANIRNRLFPTQAIVASGIDYQDLNQNSPAYIARYNLLVARAVGIHMPVNIYHFNNCGSLFNQYFSDVNDPLAQVYITVPYSTWVLDETSSESGSELVTTPVITDISTSKKLSVILDIFEQQIDALLQSATLNYLYTDVLKFAGNNGAAMFNLPLISQDIVPAAVVYDEEFLINIENALFMGAPITSASTDFSTTTISNNVVHDANRNIVKYAPVFEINRPITLSNLLFNFHKNDNEVTLDDKIAAQKFRPYGKYAKVVKAPTATSHTVYRLQFSMADHYLVKYAITGGSTGGLPQKTSNGIDVGTPSEVTLVGEMSQFRAHPILYGLKSEKNPTNNLLEWYLTTIYGELDNFTIVDRETIANVNFLALMSLFRLS